MVNFTLNNLSSVKSIDLKNCTKLQTVDVSGCNNLEELILPNECVNLSYINIQNTSVSSLTVPEGCSVKNIKFSDSITQLVLTNLSLLEIDDTITEVSYSGSSDTGYNIVEAPETTTLPKTIKTK